jgi:hypothetical protein
VIKHCYFVLFVLTIISSPGCGVLYTNVVRPHSRDFNNTPIGSKKCTLSAHKIQVPIAPLARSRVSAEWDTERINDAAQKAGITKIYYTELKTQEILLGTYRRQTLIIYGD